ncbi:MAG: ParA family protein [Endozoicomonadaceae bacterium]|nr:ParA family protein [Endozoicomonadaceae bacterium]
MGKIIVVGANKGGVGKSTTTYQIAGGLAHRGHSVLVLDCDTGEDKSGDGRMSSYLLLQMRQTFEAQVPFIQISMLPSNTNLNMSLRDMKGKYDFIIVDTAGYATMSFKSACAIADKVIIPTEITKLAYPSLASVAQCLRELEENLAVAGTERRIDATLVVSRFDSGKKPCTKKLKKFYAKHLIQQFNFSSTTLKSLNAVSTATDEGLTVYDDKSFSKAKGMYDLLISEILDERSPKWSRGQALDSTLLTLVNSEDINE